MVTARPHNLAREGALASARFCSALILLLLGAPAGSTQELAPSEASELAGRIEKARELAETLRKKEGIPGLAVAVAREGRLVWSEGLGSADVENRVPVTRQTCFRIGSLSKLLTAACAAKLAEQGRLDLDAPIQTYVSYFPPKEHAISVRQLCSHTAGIRHYGPNDGLECPRYFETVRDGIRIFEADPLLFEPGTRYSYSSYGYNLASAAIEGASGMDFQQALKTWVIEPLGLQSTSPDNWFEIVPHRTSFYHRLEDGTLVNAPPVDNSYKWASGGLLSSADDLVKLGLAHCEPGFFEAETLETILTPQPNARSGDFGVGLGWRISRTDAGEPYYHHGGAIAGGRAFILVYPKTRSVAVLLANLFAPFGHEEAHALLQILEGAG